ncbi:DUF2312 domain-containing protein [Rhizobium phaseoli]|uniref:DUF2312 domain-containing protein n=1 Tax=Rhizobium phaseoli TaxID=396 RepID=UPI00255298E0|nr:DUF2312 domain-containing protein [Rhizobium phaseoli]MDK4730524.1 DUF2312 domain-containing protein [Rhizobium phaseoli]
MADNQNAAIGHNSVAGDQLKSFVERIERLQEEKQTIADDIKDVFGEAKGMGFDRKVLTEMLRLRKMDEVKRQEWEHLRDTYGHALGIFG